MSSFIRQLSFGLLCGGIAFAVAGCSSEDAGKTLSVEFTTNSGLVMVLDEPGTAAAGAIPATPDIYKGTAVIVAKVVYRGPSTTPPGPLVYKWTYSLPSGITATGDTDNETLTLTAEASTPIGVPLSGGTGSVKLEVYEKSGTHYEAATSTLPVVVGFSG